MTSVLKTFECRRNYSSTALFVFLEERTLDCNGLLAQIWTAKCILELLITGRLTLALTTKGHPLTTTLAISNFYSFALLPSLLFILLSIRVKYIPPKFPPLSFSDSILRRKSDPFAVAWFLLHRCSGSGIYPYQFYTVMDSCPSRLRSTLEKIVLLDALCIHDLNE